MSVHYYWTWYMTYIIGWQVLLPIIVSGVVLGYLAARLTDVDPVHFAVRTILIGNIFDVVVIGSELHIAHKSILPAMIFLPSAYGLLWIVYGISLAVGASVLMWKKTRWVRAARTRARRGSVADRMRARAHAQCMDDAAAHDDAHASHAAHTTDSASEHDGDAQS